MANVLTQTNQSISALFTPSIIGNLITHLGEASFTKLLRSTLEQLFAIDYLTLVYFDRHERRHEITSVAWLDHAGCVTEEEMAQYLAHLWQMDPISQLAKTVTSPELIYLTPDRITEHQYKKLFYGDDVISETCTWMGAIGNRIFTLTLWRTFDHEPLSAKILDDLRILGDLLIPLISKHADLIPARHSTEHSPSILASLFDRRLKYQRIEISIQERTVCLGILFGRSLTQIAKEMNVKASSATSYRDRAFAKLALKNNQALFTWCLSSTK